MELNTTDLRRLADAATEGPWEAITDRYDSEIGWYIGGHIPNVAGEFRTEHDGDHPPLTGEDAEFIAAARTAVPALLDENAALRARIQAVRDVLDRHAHYGLVEADDLRRALDGDA